MEKANKPRTPLKTNYSVNTLTIYMKPYACKGSCIFCFTEKGMPKSSLNHEDTHRASALKWDSTAQLKEHYSRFNIKIGEGSKMGINIMGGSFTAYKIEYIEEFIKGIYEFFNAKKYSSLKKATYEHRFAHDRITILSVQTKPELVTESWCKRMQDYGITEVQIGVQSLNNDILRLNRRGHDSSTVAKATQILKKHGFSVTYHMMIGMIGSEREQELEQFKTSLWEPAYSPDYLKVYPCIAVKDVKHNLQPSKWFELGWKPLSDNELNEMLDDISTHIPEHVFIRRLQRLVPEEQVLYGPSKPINLSRKSKNGKCIFHRSVSNNKNLNPNKDLKYMIRRIQYGDEYYIEACNNNVCIGHLRLTKYCESSYLIRDFRILGEQLELNTSPVDGKHFQSRGIGKALIEYAKNFTQKTSSSVLYVFSPNGVFDYFISVGFEEVENNLMRYTHNNSNKHIN